MHGVCAGLKALDAVLNEAANPMVLTALSARFDKPIRHGDMVEVRANNVGPGEARIELLVDARRVQVIDAVFAEPKTATAPLADYTLSASSDSEYAPTCQELAFADAVALEDKTRLTWNVALMVVLFPALTKILPQQQVALVLGLTKIVGTECPGMHSIFGRYTVAFSPIDADFAEHIGYRVTASDERFSRITMAMSHSHGTGEIEAFFRSPPIQQARKIQAKCPAWTCTAPCLPRMLTDQTSAVAVEEPLRIAEVMLPYLSELSR